MANVQGIGGVFIRSNDFKALAKWYEDVLGVEMETMPEGKSVFKVFWTRDHKTSEERANPVFAIEQSDGPIPEGEGKAESYLLNLRVDDLEGFLEQLKAKGIDTIKENLVWEGGKHAWIRDIDGNTIELYEELKMARPE